MRNQRRGEGRRAGAGWGVWVMALFLVAASGLAVLASSSTGSGGPAAEGEAPASQESLRAETPGIRGRAERQMPLPADFPSWGYHRYGSVGNGMFMVSVKSKGKPWLIVFDSHGVPRWWFRPTLPALQAQILPNGTAVWSRAFNDGYGVNPRMAQEVHSLSGRLIELLKTRRGTITDGHEVQPAPGGGLYLDDYAIRHHVDLSRFGGPSDTSVAFAEIQEISSSGRLLWHWNSRGHIALAETGRWWHRNVLNNMHVVDGYETYDAVHINSIEPWGKNQVVMSARHTDAIFGIDKASGEIIWKLGGTKTPQSLRVIGGPYADELFGGQHDARIHPGNVLSVYDDGTHRPRPPRAVFYKLDLHNHTATFIRELTDPLVTHSHCCGSVRPFEGGWLVDWGDNPLVTGFNAEGEVTFRLRMPSSSYRAVPVPPGITASRLKRAMEKGP